MTNMGAWLGMLVVETIAKIRRAYFVQKKSIKAICRELGLSRKVVRKVLRSDATEFHYTRETQPLPKIVNRHPILTPDRRPILTPLKHDGW